MSRTLAERAAAKGQARRPAPREKWPRATERRPLPPEARAIVAQLVALRRALGITQTAIDWKVGWADMLCGKLEAEHRHPSLQTLAEWAQSLNARVVIVPRLPMRPLA